MAKSQVAPRLGVQSSAQTDQETFDTSASVAVSFTDEPSSSTTTAAASLDASATLTALAATTETTVASAATADLGAILKAAMAGGYLAHLTGPSYTVTSSIVINVTSTIQGPMGIDLGGAHIVSQITDGSPVIQINVGAGVDLRYVTLSNFTIDGNGLEGDGIRIVADGNDRWMYCWTLENVTVQHVGGFGLDVKGSVFEGIVSNSWMIGNAQGGASFAHSNGGGQVSALRWFGGGFQDNGGAGLLLDNGARDISVDGVTFAHNAGAGISAASGVTSVSDSAFQDNGGVGVWFQNFGNFNANTFSSSGTQAVGISGYLAGGATLVGNSSAYTGSGADTTTLASLQGNGTAFLVDDSGKVVTGQNVAVSGTGGGNLTHVTVSTDGVHLASTVPVAALTTAAVAGSTGTGVLETALKAALAGGTVVHMTDTSYTVTSSIIINITASFQGPLGIDLGGAKIVSQIAGGGPVIQINIAAGVDIGTLTLSNFSIQGNGLEGDGIKIVADGADRWIRDLDIRNVDIEHVGGIGLDLLGNVQGSVFDSWMHGNVQGGARIANSAGGGVADNLEWVGGGFRKNDVAGLILDNGAHNLTIHGAYFVDNQGPGIQAMSGITLVRQSGFENNLGTGAIVGGAASFADVTFSTWGVQTVGIGGYLTADQVSVLGVGNEYYGAGADPTVLANLQGTGVLAIAGTGNVVVGPGITLAGGTPYVAPLADTTAPVISSITASGAGILAGTGTLNAGDVVLLTVALSEAVTVTGTPTLVLNDGGTATYVGGSGSTSLAFSYTVAAGQNTADLTVTAVNLNGATISDAAGNAADLSAAANNNPAGVLRIDTTAPVVSSIAASGTGITNGSGTIGAGMTVTLTVNTSEPVTVTGTPSLTLNDGGTATYVAGSGTSALTFSYTAAAGQNTADLSILGLSLNGGTIVDLAGNAANLSGATAYNPAGVLAVDTTAAAVLSISASGTGIVAGSGSLNAGKTVTLTVNMNEVVTVTGAPTLILNDGGTATYTGGSGTSTLTFSHTVLARQNTPDLAILGLNLNGGAIRDAAGTAADLSNATGYNPAGALVIDTTAPTVASIAASGTGIVAGSGSLNAGKTVTLTVSMNEAVTVTGVPTLTLNDGGTATYTGGSGTSTLTFSHTVVAGQVTSDLAILGLNLNGGTIRDAAGNAADLVNATGYNPAGTLSVDTTAPTVASIATSGTGIVAGSGTLNAGKTVTLTVALSEAVIVSGAPTLTLNDGGIATYAGGSGTAALSFSYTVATGENTPDLAVTSFNLNGATLRDAAGNAADLSNATGSNPAGTLSIDTTAPTVASIATSGTGIIAGSGTLTAGKTVTLTVALSEAVTVTGTPTLTLNDGGTATYAGGSGTAALAFSYTVATGENTPDLAVSSFNLNGATLRDVAGNLANLAGAAGYNPAGTLKIDTTAAPPTVTERLANDTGASLSDRISASPALVGTADANSVVRFTVDGVSIAATATADTSGVWSFTPTGLADGTHTIVASQTNAAGATGTASLSFTLDTTAPTPVFTGAVLANGQVTLSGMTGGAGDVLSIYDGYSWLGFATTGSDGRFTFTAAADPHAVHSYGANATDLAGNVGRTAAPYVIDPTPPPVVTAGLSNDTGASSTDRITSDPTLHGTADAGAVVHFAVDGTSIAATATADASGAWSFTPNSLADGAHTIVASETNAAGATGTASLSFTLDTTAPQPVFDGAVQSNGQVTLTGSTGGAGDTVSIYDGTTLLGVANADNGGHFTFSATASSSTVHSYSANASDLAGHSAYSAGLFQLGSTAGDSMAGSSAGDVLQGGGGADTLTGGAGADRFVYKAAADSTSAAPDTITDFLHGVDVIDFSSIAGLNAANGTVEFQGKLAGKGSLTLNPHSVAFLETGGNTLVLANTTDVAELVKATDTHAADIKLVLLGTHLGLTGSDFDLFGV